MHLYVRLLLHCQDSIVDEARGSEVKSQQRESDGQDSLMIKRLIEIVSNQTQSNSNSDGATGVSGSSGIYSWVTAGQF